MATSDSDIRERIRRRMEAAQSKAPETAAAEPPATSPSPAAPAAPAPAIAPTEVDPVSAPARPPPPSPARRPPPAGTSALPRVQLVPLPEVEPPAGDLTAGAATSGDAGVPELRYEVEDTVARGGMGTVYRVRDVNVKRAVAMKLLTAERTDLEDLLRFMHEAQITGQLEHPNIVPVHDLGCDVQGLPYYTMKLIKGETLQAVLAGLRAGQELYVREWPLSRLLTVFQKACDAVAFAHSRGVVHRDLKPENIMLGDFGEVQVMDWGIAKVLPPPAAGDPQIRASVTLDLMGKTTLMQLPAATEPTPAGPVVERPRGTLDQELRTRSGTLLGTPLFMAPEQAHDSATVDQRADIYALGAILYNMLSLDPPVTGQTMAELLVRKSQGKVRPLKDYNPRTRARRLAQRAGTPLPQLRHCPEQRIPVSLAAVAMKALAVRREDRYQRVPDLQTDVERSQAGFATDAENANLLKQLFLLLRRRRREALIVLGAVAAIFLLLVVFSMISLSQKRAAYALVEELQAEQQRTQELQRMAAPLFAAEATREFEQDRPAVALRAVESALNLDPELGAAWVTKGRVHLGQLQLGEAAEALSKGATLNPGDEDKRRIALWLRAVNRLRSRTQVSVTEQLAVAEDLARGDDLVVAGCLVRQVGLQARRAGKVRDAIAAGVAGLRLRNPAQRVLVYPSPVVAEGTARLDLSGNRQLTDLSPLAGLPLTELVLDDLELLTDLAPLKDMPLRTLSLARTNVSDLSALAGLPLQDLDLTRSKVTDLSPLAGLPLTRLSLRSTAVSDLGPLSKTPLKKLDLGYTDRLGTLAPLQGLPLEELNLERASIDDLGYLRALPLRVLGLEWADVTDLAPLQGLRLEELNVQRTPLRSIAPLKAMPLKRLYLAHCRNLTDLTDLATIPTLTALTVPEDLKTIGFLRDLPNLKTLGTVKGNQPASDFWRTYKGN